MSLSDSNTPRTLRPTNPFCAAVLIAVAVLFSAGCNKNTARIPVHPVVGTIQFRGQPAEGAFVSLYPKSAIEGVPNPRGTVSKDGSF
ncbi:MAG: hypothetical protein IT427_16550, partial [Pirellulales bacterium]|nr:hypothetical protein [Pirellulales bacterium]